MTLADALPNVFDLSAFVQVQHDVQYPVSKAFLGTARFPATGWSHTRYFHPCVLALLGIADFHLDLLHESLKDHHNVPLFLNRV